MDSRVKYLRPFIFASIRKCFSSTFSPLLCFPPLLVLMYYRICQFLSRLFFYFREWFRTKNACEALLKKEAIIKFEDKNKFDISQKCRVKFSMKLVGRINWSLELTLTCKTKKMTFKKLQTFQKKETLSLLTAAIRNSFIRMGWRESLRWASWTVYS